MILHTVNKSPATHSALYDCAAVALAGDALLLLEDGVYGSIQRAESEQLLQTLQEHQVTVYAIEADVHARGLTEAVSSSIKLINYDEFVELATRHQSIQSWY